MKTKTRRRKGKIRKSSIKSGNFLESFLDRVARVQYHFGALIIIAALIFTVFMGIGVTKVRMESDFMKEMPQQLPIFQLNNKITDKLGGQDVIIILFSIDEELDYRQAPRDIRDPVIVDYLITLEEELRKEPSLNSVVSAGTFLSQVPYNDIDDVKVMLSQIESASEFYSRDYRHTIMIIRTDIGSGSEATDDVTNLIDRKIMAVSTPPGVKATITGMPPLGSTILYYLQADAIKTITLAAGIILLLLFLLQLSIRKGLVIFTPLAFGVIWTMGTLGWLGIKLSVATVGIGAMILGLGVEYGVFMLTRYVEERETGKNRYRSLRVAVPGVGSAVLGSGTTTIIGFIALTLSFMPMLQHLGLSLALGIFYCLIAAVFIEPVIIIMSSRFEQWHDSRKEIRISERKERLRRLDK